MEVPVLNMITGFGRELGSIPDPNFLSRIFTSFSIFQQFWKWGALFIALLATFSGIINRLKTSVIVIRRRTRTTPISEPLSSSLHGGENSSLISENFRSLPLSRSESEDENEGDQDREPNDRLDFLVKGSVRFSGEFDDRRFSGLRRRHGSRGGNGDSFSWPCFVSDKSVVKQWGDVKLKCEFEELSGSVILVYDENEEAEICSIFSGGDPLKAAALSAAKMVVAARESGLGNMSLKIWDTRDRSQTPVIAAEWNSPKIVDVYPEEVEKVDIGDKGAAGMMVGDVRKFWSASEKWRKGGGEGWWESAATPFIVL
ncbi:hypothetical protein SDJN03_07039, partial [Cucurbita argyrosperma subsp. sororia]